MHASRQKEWLEMGDFGSEAQGLVFKGLGLRGVYRSFGFSGV